MNLKQLESLVVRPALQRIPRGYTESAVIGFLMTCAHESARGEYLRQVGCCGDEGAFGLIQMEKATHDDCWLHSDTIWNNANQAGVISLIEKSQRIHPPVERLIYDLDYNVFMWRQQMFRSCLTCASQRQKRANRARNCNDN